MGKNLLSYRKDIDGIRAIAVLVVIIFHMGYLPNGYLGVDVFFVISGYLITKIVYGEALEKKFSIIDFYLRRIRRIIPLVLFTTLTALLIGLLVMLPDDLENLSQSVFATNFFVNNILLLVTTGNYWDLVNEYKPLMHTWSLGVEEQFYIIYPIIFLFFNGKKSKYIFPILLVLTIVSFVLYIIPADEANKFYSIQFRFFELSFGGLGAIIFRDKLINSSYKIISLLILFPILLFDFGLSSQVKLITVVIASLGLLISQRNQNKWTSLILENKMMIGIGKISFSLYMWHQIVLAYTRYFVLEKINVAHSIVLFVIILFLSVLSYKFIEQPFRDKNKVKTNKLLLISGIVFVVTCCSSLYIYSIAGVIRDVPELEIYKSQNSTKLSFANTERNPHIMYNAKIYDLDKDFSNDGKKKVLIIGNSFARDWANVLLESKYANGIEISYATDFEKSEDIRTRIKKSDIIFVSEMNISEFRKLSIKYNIDMTKVWNVGTKNFGSNNGIYYNKEKNSEYCDQRTHMDPGFIDKNNVLKQEWGEKYIDLIGIVIDENSTIPVFTPDCKFLSQDCRHLTKAGAIYFAENIHQKVFNNMGL